METKTIKKGWRMKIEEKLLILRDILKKSILPECRIRCLPDYMLSFRDLSARGTSPMTTILHLLECEYCLSRWIQNEKKFLVTGEIVQRVITLKDLLPIIDQLCEKGVEMKIHDTEKISEKQYRNRFEQIKSRVPDISLVAYSDTNFFVRVSDGLFPDEKMESESDSIVVDGGEMDSHTGMANDYEGMVQYSKTGIRLVLPYDVSWKTNTTT